MFKRLFHKHKYELYDVLWDSFTGTPIYKCKICGKYTQPYEIREEARLSEHSLLNQVDEK